MKYIKNFNDSKKEGKPNIKKYSIGDFTILQGRDAVSNDHLTFDIGNDDDIWMHAKGVPGSHILIKVKDKLPTEDIIKGAAQIAAKNSKSKEDKIKVVYCKRKFVSKKNGMNPGQVEVDYKNANEIIINRI